jgi:ABC-type uncharacterized transport system ATPase subunit
MTKKVIMLKKNDNYAIELKGITKSFGKVIANEDVNLGIKYGEILALLGENGSGKTTLMNILSGIYYADEGTIFIDGNEVFITNPHEAIKLGIGMIHQHFKLVEVFSAMDNIVLGTRGKYVKNSALKEKILEMSNKFGLEIEPDKKVYNMSVSEKQTIEIMKVLYRGAKILILDEPTSVLTPQETEKLFVILRRMKEQGNAIIIITHKLHEVLAISDRVAILRKGKVVDTVNTRETNEKQLTELMVGRPISLEIKRPETSSKKTVLKVVDLSVVNEDGTIGLNNINFKLKSGEILGVAGVAGSGQRELCETIAGLMPAKTGAVLYNKENIIGKTEGASKVAEKPMASRALGIKPYSTETEEAFLQCLKHALDNVLYNKRKCTVHKEVSIAHVFQENLTNSDLFYTGRFDFVVYEKVYGKKEIPILAIELDGMEHYDDETVKLRDRKKAEICKAHGFELIRIENSYARRYNYIKEILIDYFTQN